MKSIKRLAAELGKTPEEIEAIRKEKLSDKDWRKMAWGIAIMKSGEEIIRNNDIVPEIYPKKHRAWVKAPAKNPRFVWCLIDGIEGRHPVLIPRRFIGKLVGKYITVDEIRDINGVTYRHEALGG